MSEAAGSCAPAGSSGWRARAAGRRGPGRATAAVRATCPATVAPACPTRPMTASRSAGSAPARDEHDVRPGRVPRTAGGADPAGELVGRALGAAARRARRCRRAAPGRRGRRRSAASAPSSRSDTPPSPEHHADRERQEHRADARRRGSARRSPDNAPDQPRARPAQLGRPRPAARRRRRTPAAPRRPRRSTATTSSRTGPDRDPAAVQRGDHRGRPRACRRAAAGSGTWRRCCPSGRGRGTRPCRATARPSTTSAAPWCAGEQQRQVLGVGRARERHRARAEVLHAVQARRVAVGEGGHDDVGAAGHASFELGRVAQTIGGLVARGRAARPRPRRPRPAPAGTRG